jgi:hypothetical protein
LWAPPNFWTYWRRENLLSLLGIEPKIIHPFSLAAIPTELLLWRYAESVNQP